MKLDLQQILADLIATPSVNPMGRTANPETDYEWRMTEHIEGIFQKMGAPYRLQEVSEGRRNIVGWIPGNVTVEPNPPIVLWEVHQDTVPTDGMTIAPWEPVVRDGRMFGRGACDVKGSMAAMLLAFSRLHAERPRGMATVVLACTVDEEFTGTGVKVLPDLWREGSAAGFPGRPNFAIVAEPTELDVVVAHKGTVRWRCHTRGRAAHSSSPDDGDSAIYRMSRVVQAFERYHNDVLRTADEHPRLGRPSLSVGLIQGGTSVNVVPDHCAIEIDRRVLPEESGEVAYHDAVRFIASHAGEDGIEHDRPYHMSSGLPDAENGELASRLGEIVRRHGAAGRPIGVPFGTDAPAIARSGVPTVVFGPGSIKQAHTADEWISLEQVEVASQILYDFACP